MDTKETARHWMVHYMREREALRIEIREALVYKQWELWSQLMQEAKLVKKQLRVWAVRLHTALWLEGLTNVQPPIEEALEYVPRGTRIALECKLYDIPAFLHSEYQGWM